MLQEGHWNLLLWLWDCPLLHLTQSNFALLLCMLEKAVATQSSTLAWKIPWTEGPGRLQSMGSLRVGYDWATSLSLFTHALEKEMATHSSVFAWRIPGTGEPGGLPSLGSHRMHLSFIILKYSFFPWGILSDISSHFSLLMLTVYMVYNLIFIINISVSLYLMCLSCRLVDSMYWDLAFSPILWLSPF